VLVDIHTHIQQHNPDEVDGMLERAAAAGVSQIIAAGTTIEDSVRAVDLAAQYPNVWAGVGLHPSDLTGPITPHDIKTLHDLAQNPRVIVMSEIGIDHMPNSPEHAWQEEAFMQQIEVAKANALPIVFHVREHLDDLTSFDARAAALSILKDAEAGEVGGAAHYFQGDCEYARRILDIGFKVSFAKPLLHSSQLQDVVRYLPLESITVETDAYPQPFKKNRARWTEPKDTGLVAKAIAQIRGCPIEALYDRWP